jgi:hypothetical protein
VSQNPNNSASYNLPKASKSTLPKGIAIGFLKARGFRNRPKRTIFDVWCRVPKWKFSRAVYSGERSHFVLAKHGVAD